MQASMKEVGGFVVIQLSGFMDFEAVDPFRIYCLQNFVERAVIFDLGQLNFVGSSGITTFLDTIRDLRLRSYAPPRFCGLSTEFKRLFATARLAGLQVYESELLALTNGPFELIPEWSEDVVEETGVEESAPAAVVIETIETTEDTTLPITSN